MPPPRPPSGYEEKLVAAELSLEVLEELTELINQIIEEAPEPVVGAADRCGIGGMGGRMGGRAVRRSVEGVECALGDASA